MVLGKEVSCLLNYGGELGQTENIYKYSSFSDIKKKKKKTFLNFKCVFKPKSSSQKTEHDLCWRIRTVTNQEKFKFWGSLSPTHRGDKRSLVSLGSIVPLHDAFVVVKMVVEQWRMRSSHFTFPSGSCDSV